MTGYIPREFIQELLSKLDIVELIRARLPLRKAGQNYLALCPFHQEKTPSFSINPRQQFYHCFGCGVHGNAIGFIMEHDRLSFVEAVELLAGQFGLTVPREGGHFVPDKPTAEPSLYELLTRVATYYQQSLKSSPKAINYLKQRGLTGQLCKRFGIGYAPAGWDNLLQLFHQQENSKQELLTTGMLIQKDETDHYYDRFRERVMFPIRDKRGRVIGFGGRVLDDSKPKYLNSPETPLFHKGNELYGLYEALQTNRTLERLLVVEGYMDVVALAQHDITDAVATLGTALTEQHLTALFRQVVKVIFCFDGDEAGFTAAKRALQVCLPIIDDSHTVYFLFLPQGEDPDSLVRQEGRAGFEQRISAAVPFSRFLLDNLCEGLDLSTLDGRAQLVELAKPAISKLSDGVLRHLLMQQLSMRVQMDMAQLQRFLFPTAQQSTVSSGKTDPVRKKGRFARGKFQRDTALPPTLNTVQRVISLLLNQPTAALAIGAEQLTKLRKNNSKEIELLIQIIDIIQQNPTINTGGLLEYWRDMPAAQFLITLASRECLLTPEAINNEVVDAMVRLLEEQNKSVENEILLKAGQAGLYGLSNEDKIILKELLLTRNLDGAK